MSEWPGYVGPGPQPELGPDFGPDRPRQPQCKPAPPWRWPATRPRGWTVDRWANVFGGAVAIPSESEPAEAFARHIQGAVYNPNLHVIHSPSGGDLLCGRDYPCSLHLVRAVEIRNPWWVGGPPGPGVRPSVPPAHLEIAALHLGRFVTGPDGRDHAAFVNWPYGGSDDGWSGGWSFGRVFVHRSDDEWPPEVQRILAPGRDHWLGAYQTPPVVEAWLTSAFLRCTAID